MGTDVARTLTELHAAPVLILAALDGLIATVACAMPVCTCPKGRTYFERKGNRRYGVWAPSADRFPLPARSGGEYVPTNVRLAHLSCNNSDGGKIGGKVSGAAVSPARRAYYQSELARANGLHGARVGDEAGRAYRAAHPDWNTENVRRTNCARWQLGRGKPCICGSHATAL